MRRLALLAVLALAACGGNGKGATETFVVVGTEMAFEAPDRVKAGDYEVVFRNDGAVPHELAFKSPSGQFVARRSIGAKQRVVMEVGLGPGTWELGCFEPGHYEAGMHRLLTVE